MQQDGSEDGNSRESWSWGWNRGKMKIGTQFQVKRRHMWVSHFSAYVADSKALGRGNWAVYWAPFGISWRCYHISFLYPILRGWTTQLGQTCPLSYSGTDLQFHHLFNITDIKITVERKKRLKWEVERWVGWGENFYFHQGNDPSLSFYSAFSPRIKSLLSSALQPASTMQALQPMLIQDSFPHVHANTHPWGFCSRYYFSFLSFSETQR